jgi:signal transduction histidine kinase
VPGVELRLTAPDTLPVVGDRDLLRRAVSNLVRNAGEALSGAGGTIRVTVQQEENVAMVEVADDGPGVPEEIRATLFRPGVSGRPGGSGLGLAMVQRIASDHQGALEWKSGDPGATFTLRIPADLTEEA